MKTKENKLIKREKGISRPAIYLTRNEKVVLKLVCLGYTNAKISKTVFHCLTKVKGIRSSLSIKLDAKNAANLAYLATKHKLID